MNTYRWVRIWKIYLAEILIVLFKEIWCRVQICPLAFKEILIRAETKRNFFHRRGISNSKGNLGGNVFNLFSKQTFSQRCDGSKLRELIDIHGKSWTNFSHIHLDRNLTASITALRGKSAKGFLEIRCISYPQVVVILYHIKGFFSFCRGSVLVLYNLSQL